MSYIQSALTSAIQLADICSSIETNVICTGLLSVLLLPKLEETANMLAPSGSPNLKPHLTITGSEVHFWTKFKESSDPHPIHALNDKSRFDGKDRYNVSKLLNIYLAREVGALASDKVVVNVVSPDKFAIQLGIFSLLTTLSYRSTLVCVTPLCFAMHLAFSSESSVSHQQSAALRDA